MNGIPNRNMTESITIPPSRVAVVRVSVWWFVNMVRATFARKMRAATTMASLMTVGCSRNGIPKLHWNK